MRNSTHETQNGDGYQEALLHLKLEGLLPANQELVVNPVLGTATVLSYALDGKTEMVQQQQAYPQMCPHEVLFAHLRSLSLDQAHQQMQESRSLTIPSVYYAVSTLPVRLRAFGWEVGSVIGYGYLLHRLLEE